jgi:hypothetical protein
MKGLSNFVIISLSMKTVSRWCWLNKAVWQICYSLRTKLFILLEIHFPRTEYNLFNDVRRCSLLSVAGSFQSKNRARRYEDIYRVLTEIRSCEKQWTVNTSLYRVIKKMDWISYFYISWTIHCMWMIYITFERGGPKFSNTAARALAQRTVVQQRQFTAKWLLCSTRFFARIFFNHAVHWGDIIKWVCSEYCLLMNKM